MDFQDFTARLGLSFGLKLGFAPSRKWGKNWEWWHHGQHPNSCFPVLQAGSLGLLAVSHTLPEHESVLSRVRDHHPFCGSPETHLASTANGQKVVRQGPLKEVIAEVLVAGRTGAFYMQGKRPSVLLALVCTLPMSMDVIFPGSTDQRPSRIVVWPPVGSCSLLREREETRSLNCDQTIQN